MTKQKNISSQMSSFKYLEHLY